MAKKTYTIDDLLSALRVVELEYEKPAIEKYLADLGFTEEQLNPELIAQIVDDLLQHWKQESAIAVQETKPAKATRSSKPAKAQPMTAAVEELPHDAFQPAASLVGQQLQDLEDVVEEELIGWEAGMAAKLNHRFMQVPGRVLQSVAAQAKEVQYDAASFRESVRGGIRAAGINPFAH